MFIEKILKPFQYNKECLLAPFSQSGIVMGIGTIKGMEITGRIGSVAADKAAVWQVSEGECRHKTCRVNCSVWTRSDTGARDR